MLIIIFIKHSIWGEEKAFIKNMTWNLIAPSKVRSNQLNVITIDGVLHIIKTLNQITISYDVVRAFCDISQQLILNPRRGWVGGSMKFDVSSFSYATHTNTSVYLLFNLSLKKKTLRKLKFFHKNNLKKIPKKNLLSLCVCVYQQIIIIIMKGSWEGKIYSTVYIVIVDIGSHRSGEPLHQSYLAFIFL